MEHEEKYSKKSLHQFSYRCLQQLAKSMGLPCNIKKVYLVELIRAKKFSSESEVKSIVERVKKERQQLADLRKSYNKANLKSNEIYYKKPDSPPITTTPKRSCVPMRCSSNLREAIIKYKPKSNRVERTDISPKMPNGSDRVLRSFNLKTMGKKAVFNVNNTVVGIIKAHRRASTKATQIEIVSHEGNSPNFKVSAKCSVNKQKSPMLCSSSEDCRTINGAGHTHASSSPVKRQRTVSGIYPLVPKEPNKYSCLQSISIRGKDGKISKIHALVKKRSTYTENYEVLNFRKPQVKYQEAQTLAQSNLKEFVMESNINNNNLQLQYPITAIENEIQGHLQVSDQINVRSKETIEDINSVTHKKIRSEQVRCNRFFDAREQFVNESLPRINEAFTQFKDLSQPLYVQASDSQTDMHQIYAPRNENFGMLESLYNIRRLHLINQPLPQITTTANTKCVFSTSVIATPRVQPSSTFVIGEPVMASGETMDGNDHVTTLYTQAGETMDGNDHVTTLYTQESVSLEQTCASIPEMVEDALEIISQDGDYMEQIGMDVRLQCLLCSWAGPMVMLEYHIKKDHSEQISRQKEREWNIIFTLGSLVQCQMCLSQIVECESTLYVLSARYEDPDCFMASISTLTSDPSEHRVGSITTYNKVTGEPHIWQGAIKPLQTFDPNQDQTNNDCLKLELSKLNLLPNSANLKLLNRELVNDSPYKVVVGQPELNDIHIILFIKIFH